MPIIDEIRASLKQTGGQIYTVSELWQTREDFCPGIAPLSYLLRGQFCAGWRVLLGGNSGVGKTTTAKALIRDHRRAFPDRAAILVDVENAEEARPERVNIAGWAQDDPNIIIMPWSGTGEGLFDNIIKMVQDKIPISCIVIDSANSLSPRSDSTKQLDDSSQMAASASMFSRIFRVSTGLLAACHISTIWLSQKRQNPGMMGSSYYWIGNAMKHYMDLAIGYTGGIDAKGSHHEDPFSKSIVGATSHLSLFKKRKGAGIPLSEAEMIITFEGGLDLGLNLALTLAVQGLAGSKSLKVPVEKDVWEKTLIELEEEGLDPNKCGTTDVQEFVSYNEGILSFAGLKAEKIFRMGHLINLSPTFHDHCFRLHTQDFDPPRLQVYPGPFRYPSPTEIAAIIEEIDQAAIISNPETDDE